MKHLSLVVALAISATSLVHGQTPAKPSPPPATSKSAGASVEQALTKMEHDATAALLKKDVVGFGKIFADDAVFTGPDGTVQTKAQLLADVKSGDLALQASDISDLKVQVHGDAAIVTYMTNDKGKYKGQDFTGHYRWTDTFVRRRGTWLIVATQGTPIPKPTK